MNNNKNFLSKYKSKFLSPDDLKRWLFYRLMMTQPDRVFDWIKKNCPKFYDRIIGEISASK